MSAPLRERHERSAESQPATDGAGVERPRPGFSRGLAPRLERGEGPGCGLTGGGAPVAGEVRSLPGTSAGNASSGGSRRVGATSRSRDIREFF